MKIFYKVPVFVMAASFSLGLIGSVAVFAAPPETVHLGSAGNFAILAKAGISTTGTTSVVGDIGISPAAATYITGFGLVLPSTSAFSTSTLITGKVYAPGYATSTLANLTTAILDMETAYTDAMGRTSPRATGLGAGNIGGMTFVPGLYKWSTGVTIPSDITLSGGTNDIWIFQIAQNMEISSGVKIILDGAQANNIFWVVAGQTTIGTTAVFNGNILDQTAIVLNTGARLNGRALAQTAVTLDGNVVTMPNSSIVSTPTQTPTVPAIPATPSTPAVPTVTSAIPATPATPAVPTSEERKAALQSQLDGLLTNVRSLQSQLQAKQQGSSAEASAFGQQVRTIAISMAKGSRGNDVSTLQQFLISQNKGPATQALSEAGATAYFGALTRAALAEFQSKVGISPALGNFGPITRAYLMKNY